MPDKKVLVVGDIMLDKYIYGEIKRISPEAPIPILLENEGEVHCVAGGAANVAMNIIAAGCEVNLFSIVGDDEDGKELEQILCNQGVDTSLLSFSDNRPTTRKLRYMGQNNQQVLRVDKECTEAVGKYDIKQQMEMVNDGIKEYSMILISDYNKGFVTEELCKSLIESANRNNIPILVDVKDKRPEKYKGATLLKPNRNELSLMTDMEIRSQEDAVTAAKKLCAAAECKYVLATLGADGMLLVDAVGNVSTFKSDAKEVYDVTGAGDTSIAYLCAGLAEGENIESAVSYANIAAGIQVSKKGTSVVYRQEVEDKNKTFSSKKILNFYVDNGLDPIRTCRENGKTIVFTNGCFDILHSGHVFYLNEAKKLGDILVVGVNSDASVKRLKGKDRPINTASDRMLLLAALESIDYVVEFEEDTPLELIKKICPNILVKGGDYKVEDIVGNDIVTENGGIVMTIPFVKGKSTTNVIGKIRG